MDKIEFLGEVHPLYLSGNQPNIQPDSKGRIWLGCRVFDFGLILTESLPIDMVDLRSLTSSFKVEYLHIDYNLPTLTQIPQSELEPLSNRRDSTVTKQVKTANFKREFNSLTNYAVEIILGRSSSKIASNYSGNGNISFNAKLREINYDNNAFLSLYPDVQGRRYGTNTDHRFVYGIQDGYYTYEGHFPNGYYGESYPINEYLYNGGLPGFLDLMPYLIKNGNLIFNSVDTTVFVYADIAKLNNRKDLIIVQGGYSGTAYFKERVKKIIHDRSLSINPPTVTTQLLPETPKRALIYLTNNTNKKLYFSFTNNVTLQSPYINPGGNLVWEHGEIVNLDGNTGLLQKYDKRSIFGLPLFVRSETGSTGTINCEQYVYDY